MTDESLPQQRPGAGHPVVREAQSPENYNPLAKQKAAAKLSRIPVRIELSEKMDVPPGSLLDIFYHSDRDSQGEGPREISDRAL